MYQMIFGKKSPYLKDGRLAEVIAAVQILSSYPWASRKVISWASKLDDESKTEKWNEIFSEHPEFFRVSSDGWVSLRWRHAFKPNYDPKTGNIDETDATKKLTRKPLEPSQTGTLISIATEMHNRAIEHEKERRWLTPLLFSILGIVIGVILTAAVM